MDTEDSGLDFDISLEDEMINQNGDPVDADFDVICTDDIGLTDDVQHDDLPAGLLTAFKKDAAEAAQAAASKRILEENSTAMDSISVSAPPPASTAISNVHQTVPAAYPAVSAANQAVPTVHMEVTAANQTLPAAKEAVSTANQTVSTEQQAVSAVNQAVSTEWNTVSPANHTAPAAKEVVSTANQAVSTKEHTVSAANQAISSGNQSISTEQQAVSTANQVVSTAHQTFSDGHHNVSAAQQAASTAAPALNSAAFPADPVSYPAISSADSTANVPNVTAASTPAFNSVSSCKPPQMLATLPSKDLLPNVTGGVDLKDLFLDNNAPPDDEWSCVETQLIVPGEGETNHTYTAQEAAVVKAEPVISFEEAYDYFKSADMSSIKPKIHQTIERRGISAWTHYFFGPPKLRNNLLPSKELTFCMAATAFDNSNSIHVRSLLALYRNLTGAPNDCRRFGNHWETIGFQGNDPSTDLRGVGLFGLLQLLYLTSKPELETLKKQMFNLSNHNNQNFPFCVMGLNLSKLVLQTLREDKLNKLCNKREDLMSVVNDAFVATYYKVFHIWKTQHKTIVDSGFVLKDVENQLRKNPQNLIKELEEYLQNPNAVAAPKKKSSKTSDKLDDFVGIADILDK